METDLRNWRGNFYAMGLFLPVLLAVLFQVADSCANADVVTRLVEADGTLYALDLTDDAPVQMNLTARYNPGSDSWARVVAVPEAVFETAEEPVSLPLTRCVPDDLSTCYRIEGEEAVLESDDGGESWKTGWQLPAGRRLYMGRVPGFCRGIEMGPYDLIITGAGDEHRVLAAFGNEGVVVRNADGSWERQAVGNAAPTAYRATMLLEILATIPAELAGWLLFVVIYGVGQYLFFMRRLRLILTPLTWAVLITFSGILLLFYAVLEWGWVPDWELLLLIVAAYCLPVYLAYRKWESESFNHMDDPEKGQQAGRIWMGSTIGLLFGGILLLALWPLGLIPFYWLIVVLVLGTALVVAWWGSNRIQQLMAEGEG